MRLTVRLFGDLRRYLPDGADELLMEAPDGTTVQGMLEQAGINPQEVWLVRANKKMIPESQTLLDGDDIEVFEPVGGG